MTFEFDNLLPAPCAPGNESGGEIDPCTCVDKSADGDNSPICPSSDARCNDPAFAAANPDICAGAAQLILKPAISVVQSGDNVQYKTYLRARGNEVLLSSGLAYTITDVSIATIVHASGNATGVSAGIATVAVTWQDLVAYAQIEVVASCSSEINNFLVLIDNSESSTVAFSGSYASRLAYAKEAAVKFVESINFAKDNVTIAYFNASGQIVLASSSTSAAAVAAILSITSSTGRTNIYSGIETAFNFLNTKSGGKILLLFSDGEDNEGSDPLTLSDPWKQQGNIIMVVALRAWGSFFDLLWKISTPGYFLSAYEATQASIITTLKSIKNYFCSGDCQAESGTYPAASLNYFGFSNWDVFKGAVDLIGLDQWDLIPGNGLYVDLAGTYEPPVVFTPSPGGIRSKTAFSFVSGRNYRFRINVAGNQRSGGIEPVHVLIKSEDESTTFLDETITPTSYLMPFTTYTFNFTAGASKTAKIIVEMTAVGDSDEVGPLIDVIVLEDLTTSTTLLSDNFDDENLVTVLPGYSYYGGCQAEPPGAQSADPTPPAVFNE